jgi:hypothetical protein
MYDPQEQLVFNSEIAVAVLGRAGEFVLIHLDDAIEDAMAAAIAKGYGYCGTLAVVKGQAAAKCEPDPDSVYTMMHAALAFVQQVADRLKQPPEGDAVQFLEHLYALEDPRRE